MDKEHSDYIRIGKKKFFLNDYGFSVRTLLDVKDQYSKNKRKHVYLIKEEALSPIRLSEKKLDEMIEDIEVSRYHSNFFKE